MAFLRNIAVRKRLHELDRNKASYPTVARTGDIRRNGKLPFIFDDTNTVIFKSNASISYPTTFESGSTYLTSDLQSDISISRTGTVDKSAIDQWVARNYESEAFSPFNETSIFEYDNLQSSFYLTGSAVEDVGLGFNSSLGSKTIIRLELPLIEKSTLLANTASSYYYDISTKKFETVNAFDSAFSVNTWGYGQETSVTRRAPPQPREERLFGPFGKNSTNVVNDSSAGTLAKPNVSFSSVFFIPVNAESLTAVGTTDENGKAKSYLASSETTPSTTQQISLESFINQPFLLEKCIVEIPFEAGAGWFDDTTMISVMGFPGGTQVYYTDAGGPAITFGLMNYTHGNSKELILSGAIIPQGDNRNGLRINVVNSGTSPASFYKQIRSPYGFKSFSEPAVIVPRPSNSQFTGSVRMSLESATSVGISTLWVDRNSFSNPSTYLSATFQNSSLIIQNLASRNKTGYVENVTGRSIFGKTTNCPPINSTINPKNVDLYAVSGTIVGDDFVFFTSEKNQKSPCLIYPKDKLVVSLSKYRSAYVSSSLAASGSQGGPGPNAVLGSFWAYQSSSHDVGVAAGTMKVTLYGSLVREGVEHHDTLNSRLDTNQVHEAIGMEPITDEFDVFYNAELSGSYIDRYITGSIRSLSGREARQLAFSKRAPPGTTRLKNGEIGTPFDTSTLNVAYVSREQVSSNSRNIQCISAERFYDTLLPDPSSINSTNGSVILRDPAGLGVQLFAMMLDTRDASTSGTENSDITWTKSFPFEPRYSKIQRSTMDKILVLFQTSWDVSNPGDSSTIPVGIDRNFWLYTSQWRPGTPAANFATALVGDIHVGVYAAAAGNTNTLDANSFGLSESDFRKYYYGTGRNRFGMSGSYGTNTGPDFKSVDSYWSYGPIIRGWKYGIYSAFPSYSKATYRRDRYGQIRDMLEQRQDARFYNEVALGSVVGVLDSPVNVRFVNTAGDVIKPYETMSSNLSTEVTSSLPYFDGVVRNREEPISFAKTNQSIVVF